MRSIFLFIWKNYFFLLFVFLELISAGLIVQNNSFHKSSFINSANTLASNTLNAFDNVTGYFGLRHAIDVLAKENERLRTQSVLAFAKYHDEQFTFNDTIYNQHYSFLSAKVINNSVYRRNNYLTLNRGKSQGVQQEMGVISSNGIVGIVKDVSDNFCTVLSVLHKSSRISVRIKGKDYFGSLIWEGRDFRLGTILDIPDHVEVKSGDSIITSGYSAIFQEGIYVGRVAEFVIKPGDSFYTIQVAFSEDLSRLSNVYIINNFYKEERQSLESEIIEN